MSILPAVTIPPDYTKPMGHDPTWVALQSRKALNLMGGHTEADQALQIVGIGAETFSYIEGHSSTPPLEGDRVTKIKKGLSSIKTSGFDPLIGIRIIAQGISMIQSYTGLYNLIAPFIGKKTIQPLLPFEAVLSPLASFFLKGDKFVDDIKAWKKAQGTDKEHASFIKLMGSTANLLLYGAQVFVFLAMTKIYVGAQVVLSTILYSSTIYEIVSKESTEVTSLKKEVETPLEISMMV